MWSILERLLRTERFPRRATTSGDFARPGLFERTAPEHGAPFVASNARGGFVPVRASKATGNVRSGFSEVELDEEERLFAELYRALWSFSAEHRWDNRCTSIAEAVARMSGFGLVPKHLAVPLSLLADACQREVPAGEAEKLMQVQGFIAEVNDIRVLLAADLPPSAAVLTTVPDLVGAYTRVDDHLSILLYQANRAMVLVGDDVA